MCSCLACVGDGRECDSGQRGGSLKGQHPDLSWHSLAAVV
jgi:hypothetical protein